MHAHGVKLFISHNSEKQANLLQNDLDSFFPRDLDLNKCKHICFSRSSLMFIYNINGHVVSTVKSFVDLRL